MLFVDDYSADDEPDTMAEEISIMKSMLLAVKEERYADAGMVHTSNLSIVLSHLVGDPYSLVSILFFKNSSTLIVEDSCEDYFILIGELRWF